MVERIITYLLCTFRNHDISLQQLFIDIEIVGIVHRIGAITIRLYPKPSRQIALIEDIYQTAASVECTTTDACYAARNRDACQTAASG